MDGGEKFGDVERFDQDRVGEAQPVLPSRRIRPTGDNENPRRRVGGTDARPNLGAILRSETEIEQNDADIVIRQLLVGVSAGRRLEDAVAGDL